jgi:hypothetical protein
MNVVIGVCLATISVIAWNALNDQSSASRRVLSLNAVQRLHLNNDALHGSIKSNVYGELLMVEVDPPKAESMRLSSERDIGEFRETLAALDARISDASLDAPLASLRIAAKKYLQSASATNELGVRDRIDAFASLAQYHAGFDQLRPEIRALTARLAEQIEAAQTFADAASQRPTQWIVSAGVLPSERRRSRLFGGIAV